MQDSPILYPQTLLLPETVEELKRFVNKINVLKLPTTFQNLLSFFKDLTPFNFLEINGIDEELEEQIKREIKDIETWGLFFRTPETLKYFAKHREVLMESLEEIIPHLKKIEVKKEEELQKLNFKQALLILCLAESLDQKLLEVKAGLKKVESLYMKTIKEKIVGEELEDFQEFQDVMETEEITFQLLNTSLRISAWKKLFPYIKWNSLFEDPCILVTERTILQDWLEDYEVVSKQMLSDFLVIYLLKASLPELFKIETPGGFPENTKVYFFEFV